MQRFLKGLAVGSAIGGVYGLLTAKRSGVETRHRLRRQVTDLTDSVQRVNNSVQAFQAALEHLDTVNTETATPTLAAIEKLIQEFQFQSEPRLKRVKDATETLNRDLGQDD
ncbi:YtxH domain-containing protein [Loigolactobacillus bifermentans]|jgi:gas vesicle protein|uniref:Gas vesicle protein n=1 Tax=Loigolactobacillus bifermentans DSM 20003 TaxID=1423726 RepID=A0A0R1H2B6_9LACO|nr:YtxH domain-containing protein [Loigolactobacillus bifermentans]KRK40376.1 hypothetical protein FC07_GL000934 [Loigolactobacillus bifermentans DSM 20003]QGG59721.1 YtxH domain-containing protein [Loigolactobacillus bifermentans]